MVFTKVLAFLHSLESIVTTLFGALTKLRWWVGDHAGWTRSMVYELVYLGLTSDRVNAIFGIHPDDFVDIVRGVGHTATNTEIWLGVHVGASILASMISQLASVSMEPVMETARLIANVYRGNRPTWAFNIVFLGNVLEYIDEDTLALLMAMGGENLLGTLSYLQQSLGWLYEMDQFNVVNEIRRAVSDIEDALTWDIDVYFREARWWFSEGYRVYHRSFQRLLAIVDRIIERALARLWELKVKLTTVYQWLLHGVVDAKRFIRLCDQINIEVDMTMKNVDDAMKMVDRALGMMDFERELDLLESAVDRVYQSLAELAARKINAVGTGNYSEFINKLVRAVEKLIAMRTRISERAALGIEGSPVEGVYPQPVSEMVLEDVEGVDVV